LAFLTQRGVRWVRSQKSKTGKPLNIDSVATEFAKVMKKLGLNGGRNFYAIRHGFQTVAEGARDMAAAQAIMGHVPATNDMGATYRERIDDERLQAVVNHVHGWLWPVADKKETK
jgi:integrase